jgi:hypothetical protein
MADIEQAIGLTAQLYSARNAAKFLWGEQFPDKVAEWRTAIEAVAAARKVDNLQATTLLSTAAEKRGSPYTALTILAAYVEMTEPSIPEPAHA